MSGTRKMGIDIAKGLKERKKNVCYEKVENRWQFIALYHL